MRHKVVCVSMAAPANPRDTAHPAGLGTQDRRWSAAEVFAAIDAGEEFVTRRPGTKGEALVVAFDCKLCGQRALRSGPNADDANRLDRHPACR